MSRLNNPKLSQPSFAEGIHPSAHLGGPALGCLQQVNVLPALRTLELGTAPQVRSPKRRVEGQKSSSRLRKKGHFFFHTIH